ncbi:MAG: hypothetical protein JWL81_808 [Verrucomicrobiales bacterium]|nr:hypothetical protein [Verrucomicrobiales bacterium]
MAGLAYGMHSRGVTYARMNGAVDVTHQYVTPAEDGIIAKILVEQGDVVQPGTVVAEMDTRAVRQELGALLAGISASRREEILRLDRTRIDLEAELREYAVTVAESSGRLGPLQRYLTKSGTGSAGSGAATGSGTGSVAAVASALRRPILMASDALAIESEIGEIESRVETVRKNVTAVEAELGKVGEAIGKIREDAGTAERAVAEDEPTAELLAALSESERRELGDLKAQLAAGLLRAGKGGVVDKLDKSAGEFVRAGDSVLQVVAPTGKIVAFLPQAELGRLKEGDKVWITPAHDRNAIYESRVSKVSPRISSVYDASSPLPNQRIYGRNIVMPFPEAAGGNPPLLSPGQTVVIHTSRPGSVPLLNRLFPLDGAGG